MRNKTLMLLVSMMLAFMSLSAQELAVKSFTHVPNDLSAQTNERLDLNGKPCALLKISVRDNIVNAVGSIIGNIENKGVTKWIYTTSRAPQIKLEFQYNFPLTIKFADYGYQYLDGYQTYEVVLVDALLSAIASQQTQPQVQAPVVLQPQVQQVQPQVQAPAVQPPPVSSANTFAVASSSSSFHSFTETVNGVSFTMIAVTGGTFTMGATPEQGDDAIDNEKPAHQVTLTGYYIGETEVTQELWQAVMGSNPSRFTGNLQRPVESVSWNDCQVFIKKLNQLTGKTFRLPTDAEWEYAARGSSRSRGYKYSGSNTIGDVAWYRVNCYDKGTYHPDYGTHPVGQKQPNELGLYDMSGNVYEWCQDWYGDYSSGSQTNPTGPSSGSYRVDRGGGWDDIAWYCRVSNRIFFTPSGRSGNLGLRLAL